jgi:hypothetical protein
MALRFTATGAPPAASRMRILSINQPITFGMKLLTGAQITGGVENAVISTHLYFLQLIVSLKTQVQHSFLHSQ